MTKGDCRKPLSYRKRASVQLKFLLIIIYSRMFNTSCWLWGLLFFLVVQKVSAQTEYFHELRIDHTLLEKEKWELAGEVNWKNLYNEPGWRRWGMSFEAVHQLNKFQLIGGGNVFYTFNRKITNFFELRPWWSAQVNIPLFRSISFRHRLRSEWRFFFNEGDNQRDNYGRIRYQGALDVPLSTKEDRSWTIRPLFEWFFIRNPAEFERFSNERNYGLFLLHELTHKRRISFGYRYETFYQIEGDHETGHIFIVSYSF